MEGSLCYHMKPPYVVAICSASFNFGHLDTVSTVEFGSASSPPIETSSGS